MAFRKDKQRATEWKQWVQRHQSALTACGLPEDVYHDRAAWYYFLDHGHLSTGKTRHWFSLAQLSRPQMQRLRDFVQSEVQGDYPDSHLLNVLRSELR